MTELRSFLLGALFAVVGLFAGALAFTPSNPPAYVDPVTFFQVGGFLRECNPIGKLQGMISFGYIWGDLSPLQFERMAEVLNMRPATVECILSWHLKEV